MATRPLRLILVAGTGTDVGKTWVSARLLECFGQVGFTVSARKLAQSFAPDDDPETLDAAVLGRASGEDPATVCPMGRWYPVAMAPPMAADVLGHPSFGIADLVNELIWPDVAPQVGVLETAGGVYSPQAADGHVVDLCRAVTPDVIVLVADAGLGTINSVRLSVAALAHTVPIAVVLNRFETDNELHQRNLRWLVDDDGLMVFVLNAGVESLAQWIVG